MDEDPLGNFIEAPAADLRVVEELLLIPLADGEGSSINTLMGEPSNNLTV